MTAADRVQVVRRRLARLDHEIRSRYDALPAPACVLADYEALCDLVEDAIRRASWPNVPHIKARPRAGEKAA